MGVKGRRHSDTQSPEYSALGRVQLTAFIGLAGDRNPRAMPGSVAVASALAEKLALEPLYLGTPLEPLSTTWDRELEAARPGLQQLASRYDKLLSKGLAPLTVLNRCAAALATLPVVARHEPDACVVWFDAHADCNTPGSSTSQYLGGMAISGAAGLWDTGLNGDLALSNVVLVGARDIDPGEQKLIDTGALALVEIGADLPARLLMAVGERRIYVHLDCDVLEPGIVPTEYRSPNGMSLKELNTAFKALAQREVIGLEIAEYEATWPETDTPVSPNNLIDSVSPLLEALNGTRACA